MKKINQWIKRIETALTDVLNSMEMNGESSCLITFDDHKEIPAGSPRTPLTNLLTTGQ